MAERDSHRKLKFNIQWRFTAVGMMIWVVLFALVMYAVSRYAGQLWAPYLVELSPQFVEQITRRSQVLVLSIFLAVLPVWVVGSYLSARQLAGRFRDLVAEATSIEKISRPVTRQKNQIDFIQPTDEIDQVKDMLSSMMDQLRRSDELFRSIVANQRELIIRWQPDISFTFVNQAFCEFIGRPAEYWLDSDPAYLEGRLRENFPELARAVFDGVLEMATPRNAEFVDDTYLTMPDGETHWVQWRTMAMFDQDGNVDECQSIGYVLTDLKRAQLELENANFQLARLSQELIGSQETERANLARFLHDEVLGELGEIVRQPKDQAVNISMIQDVIDRLRSQIYVMRSPMLEYGLSMALEDLTDTMQELVSRDEDVVFQYEVSPSGVRFKSEVETHIFRIIQPEPGYEHACDPAALRHYRDGRALQDHRRKTGHRHGSRSWDPRPSPLAGRGHGQN